MMQRLVGIFREEADLDEALAELADLRARWQAVRATGGRAYNPGWHLVFELGNLLTVSEAIARSARAADREPRRPQPPRLPGHRRRHAGASVNSVVARAADGTMTVKTTPLPDDARRAARPARRERPLTTEERCPTHT